MSRLFLPIHLLLSTYLVALSLLSSAACAQKQIDEVATEAGPVKVERLATGLQRPWGGVFLPDGRLLVTERAGQLRLLGTDNQLSEPLAGVPEVYANGQGGLLDVALAPDFDQSRYVYLSYAEPGSGKTASTALGRGRLTDSGLEGFEKIFTQQPKVKGPNHFGGRIAFSPDGHLFLTLGERFKFDPAQDLGDHLGTVVRLRPDGTVPPDNPFVDQSGAKPEIWSYGHRNVQSAAFDPATGQLWTVEFGPLGGDELNRPQAGANHGWPEVSWGRHYDGRPIPNPPTRPEFTDAVVHWSPVISPSGMIFYTGEVFPKWRGSAFISSLTGKGLVRVAVDGEQAEEVERVPLGERIREVVQAPDGTLIVLTDAEKGEIWRLSPLNVD